jgi:hypothetical protein
MTNPRKKSRLVEWIDHRLPIFTLLRNELDEYPTLWPRHI